MFWQATLIFFVQDLAYSKENIGWLNIINMPTNYCLIKPNKTITIFCIFITAISTQKGCVAHKRWSSVEIPTIVICITRG